MPLRIRFEDLSMVKPMAIGQIDYIDQTHGHKSFLSSPIKVMADIGQGVSRLCADELHGAPPYRTGGPFFLKETRYPHSVSSAGTYLSAPGQPPHGAATRPNCGGVWRVQYQGGFACNYNVYGTPPLPGESIQSPEHYDSFSNRNDLSSLGNRAYNRLRPKVSKANLFQDLYEAKDVMRTLKTSIKTAATAAKRLGFTDRPGKVTYDLRELRKDVRTTSEEFVNFQFGWKPVVESIVDICDAVSRADEYFAKIKACNDQWLPRKWAEDDIQSEVLSNSWLNQNHNFCLPHMDSASGWIVPGSGHFRVYRTQLTRVWYKGLFKYYRPEFDDSQGSFEPLQKVRQYATLLGANLNPTAVYRVLPWTWLGDWFVNASDFVQRVEDLASQGVVSKYFYLMRTTFDAYRITSSFTLQSGPTLTPQWWRSVAVKRRVGSNSPFNFSLLPAGGLSDTQIMILGALGLSKYG